MRLADQFVRRGPGEHVKVRRHTVSLASFEKIDYRTADRHCALALGLACIESDGLK